MPVGVVKRHGIKESLEILPLLLCFLTFLVRVRDRQQRVKLGLCLLDSLPAGVQFVEVRSQPLANKLHGIRTLKHVTADELIDVANLLHANGLIKDLQGRVIGDAETGAKYLGISGETIEWIELA